MNLVEWYIVIVLLSPGPQVNWFLMKKPFQSFGDCAAYLQTKEFAADLVSLPKPNPDATANIGCMMMETTSV